MKILFGINWFKCLDSIETGLIHDKFLREMILEKSVLGAIAMGVARMLH